MISLFFLIGGNYEKTYFTNFNIIINEEDFIPDIDSDLFEDDESFPKIQMRYNLFR
jgi:hypothetical protein